VPVTVIVLLDTDNWTAAGNVPLVNVIVPVAVPPAVMVRVRLASLTVTAVGLRVSVAAAISVLATLSNELAWVAVLVAINLA
jgi:hypothetical protein